jgi:hypothetical protein
LSPRLLAPDRAKLLYVAQLRRQLRVFATGEIEREGKGS